MLLDFRNNMRGVAIGITIVIALIFALTGTGSLFLSTPDSESALVVNGEDISEREVLQAIAREQSRILNSNPEIDRTLIDDVALRPQVLRQLISREVLIQAANDQDLGVAPSLINELILDAGYKTRIAANYNQALHKPKICFLLMNRMQKIVRVYMRANLIVSYLLNKQTQVNMIFMVL